MMKKKQILLKLKIPLNIYSSKNNKNMVLLMKKINN